jgi:hypothetical protein
MDFLVRLKNTSDFDKNRFYLLGEETENNIVFYYESYKKTMIGNLVTSINVTTPNLSGRL